MLEFSAPLYGSNDSIQLVTHSDKTQEVALSNLLMVYTEQGVISGQYPISHSKAQICEHKGRTQVRIHSVRRKYNSYLLSHSWMLQGCVGERLLRYFTQIGMSATTYMDPYDWRFSSNSPTLVSGDSLDIKTSDITLKVGNKYTHFEVDMDDVGVNLLHQGKSIKVELWFLNSNNLYASWFFKVEDYERLVAYFRSLRYPIANPDPTGFTSKQ